MGVNNRTPIVTNGLVMYLDAGNRNSYTSGSTTWRDVSLNNNNGTLVNGPSFNSDNGGSIVFDGIDDYAIVNNIAITGQVSMTLCFWAKCKSITQSGDRVIAIYGKNGTDSQTMGLYLRLSESKVRVTIWSQFDYNTSFDKDLNIWHFWSVQYNGVSILVYRDGVADAVGEVARSLNFTLGKLNLGSADSTPTTSANVEISQCAIYNRVLTASEVMQNYNSQKSRFNLI